MLTLIATTWLSSALSVIAPPDSLGIADVTAQRRVAGLATPQALQRLTTTDLQQRGVTDIADALRRFSGVNLRDYGGAGGLKTVSVRGLGAGHTAVSYDGLSVADTRQGQIDLGQFSTNRLGDLSLQNMGEGQLLCPVRNMAAAVVSLHTPWAPQTDALWHGSATLRQAAFGTYAPSLSVQKRVARHTSLGIGGDYFFAHNDYPFYVENGVASETLRRTNSRMQTATTEVNLHQTLQHDGQITAKAYFYHNYRRLPGMVYLYVNHNDERLKEETAFAQTRWTQRFGRFQLLAAAKYNWQMSRYADVNKQYPNGALRQDYYQREAYATAGAAYELNSWLKAAYVSDYAFTSLNSNQKADNHVSRDTWLQALSLQVRTQRLTLLLRGLYHRYWNQQRGSSSARDARRITPTATASYLVMRRPLWLYVRAGYQELFRMPTFTESYYYHLGAKTLRPELTRQLSAGLTLQASPTSAWPLLAFTADGYYNKVTDRIVSIPYNLYIWRTVNMGDVRSAGLDLTLQSQWRLGHRGHQLLFAANYSYQHCTDHTSPTQSTWHKQLAYTPEHSGAASLTWQSPWVSVVAHTTFASRRWCTNNHLPTTDLPPYSEWGFTALRSFRLGQHLHLELRADLVNAFNHHYEVVGNYPMPGRAYRVETKLKF